MEYSKHTISNIIMRWLDDNYQLHGMTKTKREFIVAYADVTICVRHHEVIVYVYYDGWHDCYIQNSDPDLFNKIRAAIKRMTDITDQELLIPVE